MCPETKYTVWQNLDKRVLLLTEIPLSEILKISFGHVYIAKSFSNDKYHWFANRFLINESLMGISWDFFFSPLSQKHVGWFPYKRTIVSSIQRLNILWKLTSLLPLTNRKQILKKYRAWKFFTFASAFWRCCLKHEISRAIQF